MPSSHTYFVCPCACALLSNKGTGIKGTRVMQTVFKELCRSRSCFLCVLCSIEVPPGSSCLEHACTVHPSEMENLSHASRMRTLLTLNLSTVTIYGPLNVVINYCHIVLLCILPSGSLLLTRRLATCETSLVNGIIYILNWAPDNS